LLNNLKIYATRQNTLGKEYFNAVADHCIPICIGGWLLDYSCFL